MLTAGGQWVAGHGGGAICGGGGGSAGAKTVVSFGGLEDDLLIHLPKTILESLTFGPLASLPRSSQSQSRG